LWNGHAVSFNRSNEDHPVVAVKGAKVSDYNGVSLNTLSSTLIMVKFTLFNGSFTEAKFCCENDRKSDNGLTCLGSLGDVIQIAFYSTCVGSHKIAKISIVIRPETKTTARGGKSYRPLRAQQELVQLVRETKGSICCRHFCNETF
jgi:hypothetical protein